MRTKMFILAIVVFSLICSSAAHAGDGIPDNCEYTGAAHYRANIFPRYEPQNRRLLLVDWTTGADVQMIGCGCLRASGTWPIYRFSTVSHTTVAMLSDEPTAPAR